MAKNDDKKITPEQEANMTYTESDLENVGKGIPTRASIIQEESKIPMPEIINGQFVQPDVSGGKNGSAGSNGTSTGVVGTGTTEEPGYLADWSKGWEKGMSWLKAEKGQKAMPTEVIQDYNRWAKNNGKEPLDAFQFYPWLAKYDATKSIGENEKDERRRKNQEKWERIGNVLSHIGNFFGTLNGAPSQKLESGQELTKRQQDLYDKVLRQRELSNRDMMSAYYRQLAEERQREVAESNRRYREQEAGRKEKDSDSRRRVNESTVEKNQAQRDATRSKTAAYVKNMAAKTKVAIGQARNLENGLQMNGSKVKGGSSGRRSRLRVSDLYDKKTITTRQKNDDGSVTVTTVRTNVPKGKVSSLGNTPPNRRNKNTANNDNVAPTRRKK